MAPGGVVYALDSALAGQACSVAAWKGGEFVSSAMLRVPEPLGIRVLDEGRPVIVGGSGTVVVLGELAAVGGGQLPETVGHQLHRNVTCVAKQPHSDVLALGVPEGDEVVRVGLPGFATSCWVDGLPARPVAVAFSGSGDRLATGLDDGSLLVVDTRSGARAWVGQPSGVDGLGVVACAAGADDGWVVAYESEHLAVWDSAGRQSAMTETGFAVSALHVDPGSGRVVVGGLRGELSVLSADLGRVLAYAPARGEPAVCVLLLPDADTLVSGSEAGAVEAFELR
jgi:WD40 repeat protein